MSIRSDYESLLRLRLIVIEAQLAALRKVKGMNLIEHIIRQKAWSEKTFGPSPRVEGILQHIEKEMIEVRAKPTDAEEWIDIVILALDGAWRSGATPAKIAAVLERKQTKNENRTWPDWRLIPDDLAIEHDRTNDDK